MCALIRRIALAATLCLSATLAMPAQAAAKDITIFAAASMKTALDGIVMAWNAETGHTAVVSYGSSSVLAKQIQEGAPADLFISAAVNWMDTLEEGTLIKPETRIDLVGNSLVLVAYGADAEPVEIAPGFDLAGMLGENRLAMALVDSVPAGVYGKAALSNLGVWDAVEPKVAQADNVRAALALVATGEAPLGIVYGSDAVAEPGVSVAGVFPAGSHPPIIFPAAVMAESAKPEAEAFLTYLSGAKAQAAFEAQGFTLVKK